MGGSPVVMVIEWDVPSGQACPVTTAIQRVMLSTRHQRGCMGCSLVTDTGERVTLRYTETWATEDDLKRQVRSERFDMLARLIESATCPPRVEFALPTGTFGLEYVDQLRGAVAKHPERA